MRRLVAVGQHADADAQRLDRIETAGRGQELGHLGEGLYAGRRQARGDRRLVAAALGVALPQERRDAFEAARRRQFLDRMAAHDQPAGLAIDLAHRRVGHDDAIEAAIHPCQQHLDSLSRYPGQGRIAEMYCQS